MAIYNPDIPLTFIHIPKTAGSSVSHWLKMHTNATDFYPKSFGSKHWVYEKVQKHMKRGRLNPGRVVVVVRNPWDRLLSMWSYYYDTRGKVQNYGSPKNLKRVISDIEDNRQYHHQSFRDFILNSDWGFARYLQTDFFPDDALILRFENLKQDFKQIQKLCNCNEPLPWVNTSQHDEYTSMYDEEMIEEVRRRASDDIVKLGYEFR